MQGVSCYEQQAEPLSRALVVIASTKHNGARDHLLSPEMVINLESARPLEILLGYGVDNRTE